MSLEMSPSPLASASGLPSGSKGFDKDSEFSETRVKKLRPYQRDVALAVLDSIFGQKGLTFSVEIARQGGKNELSAQLELLLLTLYMGEPQNLVKCSPTFKPQTVISMINDLDLRFSNEVMKKLNTRVKEYGCKV